MCLRNPEIDDEMDHGMSCFRQDTYEPARNCLRGTAAVRGVLWDVDEPRRELRAELAQEEHAPARRRVLAVPLVDEAGDHEVLVEIDDDE